MAAVFAHSQLLPTVNQPAEFLNFVLITLATSRACIAMLRSIPPACRMSNPGHDGQVFH